MADHSGRIGLHLVLAGGGVQSLSYAGALSVLVERGFDFKSVSACSAGTFVGALLCCGLEPEEIVERLLNLESWKSLAGERASPIPDFMYGVVPGLLPFHPMLSWPFAQYRESGFDRVFEEIVDRKPRFAKLEPSLTVAAFDLKTRRYLVYDKKTHGDMAVSEALKIAVSFPFAYKAETFEGRILVDAGLASECPVWLAADRPFDHGIVALRPLKKSLLDHPQTLTVGQYYAETIGSVVRGLDDYIISKMPRVRLIEIDCEDLRADQFDLSKNQMEQLIECGRKAACYALSERGYGPRLNIPRPESRISSCADTSDPRARHYNDALRHGTELMRRFHQNMSKDMPTRVFVSYSHQDREVAHTVVETLIDQVKDPNSIWYDKRLEHGDKWRSEILKRMRESRVAVYLVSEAFLSSDFIRETERRFLSDQQQKGGMKIFPFLLEDCEWKQNGEISEIQVSTMGKPYNDLDPEGQKEALGKLAERIDTELQQQTTD
jgi:NTE family protein